MSGILVREGDRSLGASGQLELCPVELEASDGRIDQVAIAYRRPGSRAVTWRGAAQTDIFDPSLVRDRIGNLQLQVVVVGQCGREVRAASVDTAPTGRVRHRWHGSTSVEDKRHG
jgi:hypothetical protein